MSIDVLSSIYSFALSIVTSAQPVWDGGVINFFLTKVLFLNASEKQPPAKHFVTTINSGGYLIGLVFGIMWAVVLLLCGLWLIIMHCRRKSESKTVRMYSMLANRIQFKNDSLRRLWQCVAIQSIMSVLFVVIAIVFCILGFVVNAHLNFTMTSKKNENALIPRIDSAVGNIKGYVDMFVPHARLATKPLVDGIILDIDKMQNNSKEVFTEALTKRMSGDVLAHQGQLLIDAFEILFNNMQTIQKVQGARFRKEWANDLRSVRSKWTEVCSELKDTPVVLSQCLEIKKDLGQDALFGINFEKVRLDDAGTFVKLLTSYGQTPEKMKEKMNESLKKKAAMEKKMYLKSKKLLKVEEVVRNMTSKQWDDLETKLQGASAMLQNVSLAINGGASDKVAKYEGIRNLVYMLVLLLILAIGLICATVFIHSFCFPGNLTRRVRNTTKVTLYVLMMTMTFVVILSTATFLIGGYSQTEVCRYLEEKPIAQDNISTLHLDKMVNGWLDRNWAKIEALAGNESSMPMPRPRDIFRGLLTTCKANQSILLAINGLDTMDTSAASDPKMTERFLNLGRQLTHEGFREAKADDFLRPNMKKELNDLLGMAEKLIVKSNYSEYIRELEKPLTLRSVSHIASKIDKLANDLRVIVNSGRKLSTYVKLSKAQDVWKSFISNLADMRLQIKKEISAFTMVKNNMDLSKIVKPMLPAIDTLAKFVHNKTYWISVADELYDEIIVKMSYENSPKMMAKSTRAIMRVLGPCRHLYNAFTDVVFASCVTVVRPLNLMWFFLGVAVLFLTPTVVIALLLLTKSVGLHTDEYPPKKILSSGDGHDGQMIPLGCTEALVSLEKKDRELSL